jgi:hypothetical protein
MGSTVNNGPAARCCMEQPLSISSGRVYKGMTLTAREMDITEELYSVDI